MRLRRLDTISGPDCVIQFCIFQDSIRGVKPTMIFAAPTGATLENRLFSDFVVSGEILHMYLAEQTSGIKIAAPDQRSEIYWV